MVMDFDDDGYSPEFQQFWNDIIDARQEYSDLFEGIKKDIPDSQRAKYIDGLYNLQERLVNMGRRQDRLVIDSEWVEARLELNSLLAELERAFQFIEV